MKKNFKKISITTTIVLFVIKSTFAQFTLTLDGCKALNDPRIDICALIADNPISELAIADCDQGGVANYIECKRGGNPFIKEDDCSAAEAHGINICILISANPNGYMANADCDEDSIINKIECYNGTFPLPDDPENPDDPNMDNECDEYICDMIIENISFADTDCDEGGVTNGVECEVGNDPLDHTDDYDCEFLEYMFNSYTGEDRIEKICFYIEKSYSMFPDLDGLDCDGDRISNVIECRLLDGLSNAKPTDPLIPNSINELVVLNDGTSTNTPLNVYILDSASEDVIKANINALDLGCNITEYGFEICQYVFLGSTTLSNLDCDGDQLTNDEECNIGTDPEEPTTTCSFVFSESLNVCEVLDLYPELAFQDCDGGGISNILECKKYDEEQCRGKENGTDPLDKNDEYSCGYFYEFSRADLSACSYMVNDTTLALCDCDYGGVANFLECIFVSNPFDASDDYGSEGVAGVLQNTESYMNYLQAVEDSLLLANDLEKDDILAFASEILPIDCEIVNNFEIDICGFIKAGNTQLGAYDCDNGGLSNEIECLNGTDPTNPDDDYLVETNFDLSLISGLSNNKKTIFGPCENLNLEIVVYNTGDQVAKNIEITTYLPKNVELYLYDSNGWTKSIDNNLINVIEVLNPNNSEISIQLELTLTGNFKPNEEITIISEISNAFDENGNIAVDIDSNFDQYPDNDAGGVANSPNDNYISGNGTGNYGDSIAETDEDDHDPVLVKIADEIFDLALASYIPSQYFPLVVCRDFNVRNCVYNMGTTVAKNIEITNYIPDGFSLSENDENGWKLDENGNAVNYIDGPFYPCGGVALEIKLTPATELLPGEYFNVAEISKAYNEQGIANLDIDSRADNIPNNDAGGNPKSRNDNYILGDGTGEYNDIEISTDEDDHDPAAINIIRCNNNKISNMDLSFSVFPIPAAKSINVRVKTNSYNESNINIVDINGQEYFNEPISLFDSRNDTEIDISTLPIGTYFLSLVKGDIIVTKTFIKI